MKNTLLITLFAAALLLSGCSTLPKSDLTALQGKWKGKVTGNPDHACTFVISANNFEFRDEADANVWYKGTFSLREDTTPKQYAVVISDCPFPQYVGKKGTAIYRIENGALTITANEPGDPAVPTSFDQPGAARMDVKRK